MARTNGSRLLPQQVGVGSIKATLRLLLRVVPLVLEDPDSDGTAVQIRSYVRPLAAGTTKITAAFFWNGVASGSNYPVMGICGQTVGGVDDGNLKLFGMRLSGNARRSIRASSQPTIPRTLVRRNKVSRLPVGLSGQIAFVGSSGRLWEDTRFSPGLTMASTGSLWIRQGQSVPTIIRRSGAFSLIRQTM